MSNHSRLTSLVEDDPLPPEPVRRDAERVLADPYTTGPGETGRTVEETHETVWDPDTGRPRGRRLTRSVTVRRDPSAPAAGGELAADAGETIAQIILGLVVVAGAVVLGEQAPLWAGLVWIVVGGAVAIAAPTFVRTRGEGGTGAAVLAILWYTAALLGAVAGLYVAGWTGLSVAIVVLLAMVAVV